MSSRKNNSSKQSPKLSNVIEALIHAMIYHNEISDYKSLVGVEKNITHIKQQIIKL